MRVRIETFYFSHKTFRLIILGNGKRAFYLTTFIIYKKQYCRSITGRAYFSNSLQSTQRTGSATF